MLQKLFSAAVVIGALDVNRNRQTLLLMCYLFRYAPNMKAKKMKKKMKQLSKQQRSHNELNAPLYF